MVPNGRAVDKGRESGRGKANRARRQGDRERGRHGDVDI